jgi:NADPH:quinone reductase-like Zn-dependent oxidoreductase
MKAMVRDTYGPPDLLRLEEVQKPSVGEGEVLVRVHAASANAGDWHLMRGTPLPFRLVEGLRTPRHRIIGTDIAGRVEAVGPHVSQFRPGDQVFGELSRCGFGGYAEYVAVPETLLATMSDRPSRPSKRQDSARTEDRDSRRRRRGRDVRCATREGVWH